MAVRRRVQTRSSESRSSQPLETPGAREVASGERYERDLFPPSSSPRSRSGVGSDRRNEGCDSASDDDRSPPIALVDPDDPPARAPQPTADRVVVVAPRLADLLEAAVAAARLAHVHPGRDQESPVAAAPAAPADDARRRRGGRRCCFLVDVVWDRSELRERRDRRRRHAALAAAGDERCFGRLGRRAGE